MSDLELRRLVKAVSMLRSTGWHPHVCLSLYIRHIYLATHGGAE